mgnify:CR=1 FL=1
MNHTNIEVKEVSNNKFSALHSKMDEYIEQKEIPCAITLVYQNDEVIFCEKSGMAEKFPSYRKLKTKSIKYEQWLFQ